MRVLQGWRERWRQWRGWRGGDETSQGVSWELPDWTSLHFRDQVIYICQDRSIVTLFNLGVAQSRQVVQSGILNDVMSRGMWWWCHATWCMTVRHKVYDVIITSHAVWRHVVLVNHVTLSMTSYLVLFDVTCCMTSPHVSYDVMSPGVWRHVLNPLPSCSTSPAKQSLPLMEYVYNVVRFIDAILSNNATDDHCKEFVKQGQYLSFPTSLWISWLCNWKFPIYSFQFDHQLSSNLFWASFSRWVGAADKDTLPPKHCYSVRFLPGLYGRCDYSEGYTGNFL